jgi:hypothetical protein
MAATSCDYLIASDIAQNCTFPIVKGAERRGVIVNRADIGSMSFKDGTDGTILNTLILSTGKKGYEIMQPATDPYTGTKTDLKVGTYVNTWTHTIVFVVLDNDLGVVQNIIDKLANGDFLIILEAKAKGASNLAAFEVYGAYQGCKAKTITSEKYDDKANSGWIVTMEEADCPVARVNYATDGDTYAQNKTAVEALLTAQA